MIDGPIAHVTVHHGAGHPSRLRITEYTGPVEPAEPADRLAGACRFSRPLT